ncbi:MAG: Ku protein, partial [Acidimicrobiia bacterium]|nr:Ku protein [Acidimicrobiia bacterium]
MPPGRAIWSGAISFGLVNVPVKLHTATQSKDVRFNQLEAATGARIRYRKVSEATGEEVAAEDIVKGYDLGGGRYVVIDNEELASLAPKASHTIEINEFVDVDEIDPIFYESPYYLFPDRNGEKAYRLLVETMAGLGKAAIGRIIVRSKEHLAAIRAVDGVLCLETMRFADEVADPADVGDVPDGGIEVTEREVDMARQLVDSLTAKWDPDRYRDSYREQVLELIDAKAAGQEIVTEPSPETSAKVVDLMAALEASLAQADG